MGKESLVYRTEDDLLRLSEEGFKLLFTTLEFKLLGIVTWDKYLPDEAMGERRRWIKGLKFQGNGQPVPMEERVFETSLHRKNPKTGGFDDLVVHEDSNVIVMARKTFDLSDDDDNFFFIPNMYYLRKVQLLMDDLEASNRRLSRLKEEKEELFLDAEHFKTVAATSKEREKSRQELLNRLTREIGRLQERIGNLEAVQQKLRAKNIQYEAEMDERMANASEEGTVRGMTVHDQLIHAVEKETELAEKMIDIMPQGANVSEQMQGVMQEMKETKQLMQELKTKSSGPATAKTETPGGAPTA